MTSSIHCLISKVSSEGLDHTSSIHHHLHCVRFIGRFTRWTWSASFDSPSSSASACAGAERLKIVARCWSWRSKPSRFYLELIGCEVVRLAVAEPEIIRSDADWVGHGWRGLDQSPLLMDELPPKAEKYVKISVDKLTVKFMVNYAWSSVILRIRFCLWFVHLNAMTRYMAASSAAVNSSL